MKHSISSYTSERKPCEGLRPSQGHGRPSTTFLCLIIAFIIIALAALLFADKLPEEIKLPPKIRTYEALQRRTSEIERQFRPFTRNLTPEMHVRERIAISGNDWQFKLDGGDRGVAERWFSAELDDTGWTTQKVPDYRELVRGWYRKSFQVPDVWKGKAIFLRFHGVDYEATVWLNGSEIGRHTGYFGHFSFDVTNVVKIGGSNVLAVRTFNPMDSGQSPDSINNKGMGTVTLSTENGLLQHGNGAGILDDVYLEAASPTHIESVYATPALPDLANIDVILASDDSVFRGTLSVIAIPRNFAELREQTTTSPLKLEIAPETRQSVKLGLRLKAPRLWTPSAPFLYTLRATLRDATEKVVDNYDIAFGLRTIDRAEDGAIILNGKKHVLRGACSFGNFWRPAMRKDTRQIVEDILLWKAANLEAARITVHVLPEIVYEYADMYGLMLYADTPLQWVYPREKPRGNVTAEFASEAKKQMTEMVELLRNHPSVIIYEGMNEFFPTPTPFGREVFDLFKEIDPSRVVVVNSGALRPGCGESDRHIYSGWYSGVSRMVDVTPGHAHPLRNWPFKANDKGLISEYGNVALPDWETWRKRFPFAPQSAADYWDVRTIPHEQCYRGDNLGDRIQLSILAWRSGWHRSAADWIAHSQAQQADFAKTLTEAWRRRRDNIAGYFYFHLIDPGPLAWPKAIVDCDRRPKAGYYDLIDANRPLRINIDADRTRFHGGDPIDGFSIWLYNDTDSDFAGAIRAYLVDKADNVIARNSVQAKARVYESVQLPPFTFTAPKRDETEQMRLVAALAGTDAEIVDWDETRIKVFGRPAQTKPDTTCRITLYDPVGRTARALDALGVAHRDEDDMSSADLSETDVLVIGEFAAGAEIAAAKEKLIAFAERGGAVLALNQHPWGDEKKQRPAGGSVLQRAQTVKIEQGADLSWFPPNLELHVSRYMPSDYVQADLFSDVFSGLEEGDFRCWNDFEGILCEYPIKRGAEIVSLATCGISQAFSALSLVPVGKGRLVLSQMILIERVPQDPVASRLLKNLLSPDLYSARFAPSISKSAAESAEGKQDIDVRLVVKNEGRERMKARIADVCPIGFRTERKLERATEVPAHGEKSIEYVLRATAPIRGIVNLDRARLFCQGRIVVSEPVSVFSLPPEKAIAEFDFGPEQSPCVEGFTRVTHKTTFSKLVGYGWQDTTSLQWRDRGAPNALMRNFVFSSQDRVFSTVTPNGQYIVTIFIGDNDFPLHPIDVFAEEAQVVKGLTTTRREFVSRTFTVDVKDGRLDLRFHNQHAGQNWEIAGIVIEEGG